MTSNWLRRRSNAVMPWSSRTCAGGMRRTACSTPTDTKVSTVRHDRVARTTAVVTGKIATAGLSYPGAAQWLAAIEAPPHLVCAFPAMCFSSARQFFYFGGAFDLSWLPWVAINIAPDDRRRRGVTRCPDREGGAGVVEDARPRSALRVPLRDQPISLVPCPSTSSGCDHPEDGPYWHFADIESRQPRVRVPVFNFSGWHDEGYGPIGATRNYAGLRARAATPEARIAPARHWPVGPRASGARDADRRRQKLRRAGRARLRHVGARLVRSPRPRHRAPERRRFPGATVRHGRERVAGRADCRSVNAPPLLSSRRRPADDRCSRRGRIPGRLHLRSVGPGRGSALRGWPRAARSARGRIAARRAGVFDGPARR